EMLLVSAALLYGIAGPAVATRLLSRDWHVPTGTAGRPWVAPFAACAAAFVLVGLSLLPSATGAGDAFSRDALANILVSEIARPEIETDLAAKDLPTDTGLVPAGDTEKRNVVIVFLESTRAESTTPYNEELKTTPFMDDLADESLVAERAYAVLPHTSKALVASLCGFAPPLDTKNTESEPGIIPARCIPELLGEQGYKSVFFQSATENFERRRSLVENFGYDEFYPLESMSKEGYQEVNYFGYEDEIMLPLSRSWLEKNGGERPFLATYLTVTAHHDYVVPDRYPMQRFAGDPLLNRYLNILYYQDRFLEKLFQQYKDLGLYEDTIFIVLGDHGEGFGEHGRYQHDNVIYNEGLHIPLIIHDPRDPDHRRIEPPVSELDILPTVADLLGYRITGGTYPGASILDPPEERTLMASCYQERTCLAAIRGDEKYVYHYGNKGEEYFDLSEDPHERENIIAEQDEEKIDALRNELLTWAAKVEASYEQQREESTEKTGE
ncbi:MAG: sulfatase-like hydrolase/transferase, partial [Actinomycetota bacterium]